MSSIDTNNFFKMTFDRNTFIGFDKEEIKNTPTNDLLTIRRAVYDYLKSTKLKKRNANFIDVFRRMTEELQERNVLPKRDKKKQIRQGKEKLFKLIKKNVSTQISNSSVTSQTENTAFNNISVKNVKGNNFLNKNISIDLEIPSFFNDKVQKLDTKSNKINQKLTEILVAEKTNKNNLINYNLNKEEKFVFFSSDKPIFMPNKSDDDLFFPSPGENFELGLKEIELRSTMYNEVSEDMFFVLD